MVAQEVIEAAGQTLAAVADDPVKIVLFDSRARGDAGPDSDFDFLVVERDPRDRHAEMVRLGRALRPLGRPFDVVEQRPSTSQKRGDRDDLRTPSPTWTGCSRC